jgi:hypothetical protein
VKDSPGTLCEGTIACLYVQVRDPNGEKRRQLRAALEASLRRPKLSWHSLKYPYMNETVVPTLQQVRKRALKLAQTV